MAQPRSLGNPPIVEAMVDISVRFAQPIEASQFTEMQKLVSDDYPVLETRNTLQIVIGPHGPQINARAPFPVLSPAAHLFKSEDGTRVIQSKINGCTFSQLAPYRGGDELINEAVRVWGIYQGRFHPERITRISVRFINRLKLPPQLLDFDDYLLSVPKIPEELSQGISEFNSSYVIPEIALKTAARVRLAFSAIEATPMDIPVLFDIDILKECDIDPLDTPEVKAQFESLRVLKNRVFFGSLTEKALEVYE